MPKQDVIRRIDLTWRDTKLPATTVVNPPVVAGDVWLPLADGGYFPGAPVGPNIEVRQILDVDENGDPYLDAGGEQQMRTMLAARGQNGIEGVALLSGTKAQPNTATLLLLADPPTSASDTGTQGEVRVGDGYIYYCVAENTWQRAELATW